MMLKTQNHLHVRYRMQAVFLLAACSSLACGLVSSPVAFSSVKIGLRPPEFPNPASVFPKSVNQRCKVAALHLARTGLRRESTTMKIDRGKPDVPIPSLYDALKELRRAQIEKHGVCALGDTVLERIVAARPTTEVASCQRNRATEGRRARARDPGVVQQSNSRENGGSHSEGTASQPPRGRSSLRHSHLARHGGDR